MNLERFRNSPSGRLVRVEHGQTAYWAFVPHPLPPNLSLDLPLVRVLSEADRALGELAGLGRTMPNPQLLIEPFIRREAVLSSRIEGTQADIADLYAYEAGQVYVSPSTPAPPVSDVREVRNYVQALKYGLERQHTLPMSLRLICEMHEQLMAEVRGESVRPGKFRQVQNFIGHRGASLDDATFVPPPVPEMLQSLDAFEGYLHAEDGYPPLLRLALIHYQFETIHPFLDGNGRIGRLLIALLMVAWDLLPLPLLYLSAYFERRREQYYDLLLAVSERGAWEDWTQFFLQGIAEQACDAVDRAKRLQDLRSRWRGQLTGTRASALLLRLADALFEAPVLTIPEAQRLLGVKQYHSARRNVEKLVEEGILEQVGESSYGKTFLAREILGILGVDDT